MKRIDVAVFATIERLAHGALESRRHFPFPAGEGGVGLGAISDLVPPSMVAQLKGSRPTSSPAS